MSDKVYLQFGRYSFLLRLQVPEIEMPKEWQKFVIDDCSQYHAEIIVRYGLRGKAYFESDGWHFDNEGNVNYATFSRKNDPYFTVEYRKDRRHYVVYIVEHLDKRWIMGLQYAVMLSLLDDCIGLHGVTVLCGSEAIILSAPSGTGKTTLAKLLHENCRAVTVNGDFALLSISDSADVWFEPTVFAGSTRRCLNQKLRVDRIVFLQQSKENRFLRLSVREALQNLMNNVFVPEWDGDLTERLKNHLVKIVESIPINAYSFAPTKEAAEVFLNSLVK